MAIKTFKWTAPTQRVDGTPLAPEELTYRLYIDGEPFADFPGELNPDGEYEFKRDFPPGSYLANLTAIDRNDPKLESAKSNDLPFVVRAVPQPPVLVSVS